MKQLRYDIIQTGSSGNAVWVGDNENKGVMFDCGIAYKWFEPYLFKTDVILFTHKHNDHWRASTMKKLKIYNPNILLLNPAGSGIEYAGFDNEIQHNKWYKVKGKYSVMCTPIPHSVPNVAWIVKFLDSDKTCMYATDTASLDHIDVPNLDLYLLESNYSELDIVKEQRNAVVAVTTHLSQEDSFGWFLRNRGEHSEYVPLHQHIEFK